MHWLNLFDLGIQKMDPSQPAYSLIELLSARQRNAIRIAHISGQSSFPNETQFEWRFAGEPIAAL